MHGDRRDRSDRCAAPRSRARVRSSSAPASRLIADDVGDQDRRDLPGFAHGASAEARSPVAGDTGMAALPCCTEGGRGSGSAGPACRLAGLSTRAEHNTIAEGGNRRWAKTARQNAFQSRWPRADQRTSGRRHQRRLTSPRTPAIQGRQPRRPLARHARQQRQPVRREVRQTHAPRELQRPQIGPRLAGNRLGRA